VHLIVRAQGRDGQRLNPRKADLARWRQEFADRLMERGIAASATRRQSRGNLHPTRTLRDCHRGAKNPIERSMHKGPGAQRTEFEVLDAWQNLAEAPRNSDRNEDRELGREVGNFLLSLQMEIQARPSIRQEKRWIEEERERLEPPSRCQEIQPKQSTGSRER
jgi:hypothetical protein